MKTPLVLVALASAALFACGSSSSGSAPSGDGGTDGHSSSSSGGSSGGGSGSSSGGASSGGNKATGSVHGKSLSVAGEIGGTGQFVTPVDGGTLTLNAAVMVQTSFSTAGDCAKLMSGMSPPDVANSTNLVLEVVAVAPSTVTPNTYSLATGLASASFNQSDASCTATDTPATGGTVTIATIDGTTISGSYDLTFGSDALSGTFSVPVCSAFLSAIAADAGKSACTQ